MKIDDIVNLMTLVVLLAPAVFQGTKLLGEKIHYQKLISFSTKAEQVVKALDQDEALSNDAKKKLAIATLSSYAKRHKFNLSEEEITNYMESAVRTIRLIEQVQSNNRAN